MAKKAASKNSTDSAKKEKATKATKPAEKTAKKAAAADAAVVEKVEKAPKAEKPKKEAVAKAEKPPKPPKPTKTKKETKAELARAEALNEETKKWLELKEKHGKDKASHYSMSSSFEALTPIQHKVLGWGYILTNNNDRLEVLFETGKKVLISNYKQ